MDPSASISFAQHIINSVESDFMIECVNQYKQVVVDMANERSSEANSARLETWTHITNVFNDKFSLDVSTKALKSNLSYRQGKLKKNPAKLKLFREWQSNPSKSEKQMEKELGRGDFLLLKLFSEDFEKPQKRKLDESESTVRNEWNSNENETSPFPSEPYFTGVEPKEEFHTEYYDVNDDSRPSEDTFGRKRPRQSQSNQLPLSLPSVPPVNKPDEESSLRIELLRAQIELTKTQQTAAEKQIESNTSMILMMNRLMERIEKKREESDDQSSVSNLISIMKEMVKK